MWYIYFFYFLNGLDQQTWLKQPDPFIKPITKTFFENPNKLSGEAEVAKAYGGWCNLSPASQLRDQIQPTRLSKLLSISFLSETIRELVDH